ncbi:MAG: Rrf2 family transcriptional regulator [Clostridiaceae bacterium]|nr:Rrf2 family transcriptional regulator [Clostridiaceae bacterium]
MKLSVKSQYALESLTALALSTGGGRIPVSVRDIARERGIPERFLSQILSTLRQAGLLSSIRGAQGGYVLAKSPDDIRAGDVVRAVEGRLVPVDCVESGGPATGISPRWSRTACCETRGLWQSVADRINGTLDSVTLADLARCTSLPITGEVVS